MISNIDGDIEEFTRMFVNINKIDNVEELQQRVLKLERMLSIAQQEKANLEDDFIHLLSRMQLAGKGAITCNYSQKL
jgi:hypothetical protein